MTSRPEQAPQDPTLALAEALIARPSVTPDDAQCQQLVARRLERCGFQAEHLPFGDVHNAWLRHGTGEPLFVFAGHTDVVPPGDLERWSGDPFVPRVSDGWLYGRGAADMKGAVAAMAIACERFVARHPRHPGSLALLLTSDEEGPAIDGTQRVMETLGARDERIAYCVVGEPSSDRRLGDTVRIGRRGSLSGELTVHGIQGHVAYPEKVLNPNHTALAVLAELAATRWDEGNAHFPPTSFQISNLHGGTGAENVVPGSLCARFNLRYSSASTAEELRRRIEAICERHGVNHTLRWRLSAEPFLTAGGPLVEVVRETIRSQFDLEPELSTAGGTSDGRFIAPTGAQLVEVGLLNATIHQVDERVPVADLDALARLYQGLLERLLV